MTANKLTLSEIRNALAAVDAAYKNRLEIMSAVSAGTKTYGEFDVAYIQVKQCEAHLLANAPDYLRALLAVTEAAAGMSLMLFNDGGKCADCEGAEIRNRDNDLLGFNHLEDCRVKALFDALKALE